MKTTIYRAEQAIYSLDGARQVQGPATIVVRDGVILSVSPGDTVGSGAGDVAVSGINSDPGDTVCDTAGSTANGAAGSDTVDGTVGSTVDSTSVSTVYDSKSTTDAHEYITIPAHHILLPGLVDTHVHVNEPGRTDWEGFASATRAAAAGGVTTLIDMPLNSIPSTTTMNALDSKRAVAKEKIKVNVGFWGGVTPENLGTGELKKLWEEGRVFGFKCFLLNSGVDEFQPLTPTQLETAMTEIAQFDGLLIVHAEDPDLIEQAEKAQENAVGITDEYSTFQASRPPAAEKTAIATVIDAAEKTGCRAHILHLSDGDSVEQIRQAQERGVRITVETCPHYLCLFSEEIQDGATQYKCCPPIRTAANRERLWAGVRDGVIGMVVSDHSPCTAELKKLTHVLGHAAGNTTGIAPDGAQSASFGEAWGGISSVQLGLPAVWSQARVRGHSLLQVVQWMCTSPARWVGLRDRGIIAPGCRADFVAVSADEAFVVLPEVLHHKNKITAYSQRALAGVVQQTWVAGHTVYRRPSNGIHEHTGDGPDNKTDNTAAYDHAESTHTVCSDEQLFPGPIATLVERFDT